jgi:hypothetical protein
MEVDHFDDFQDAVNYVGKQQYFRFSNFMKPFTDTWINAIDAAKAVSEKSLNATMAGLMTALTGVFLETMAILTIKSGTQDSWDELKQTTIQMISEFELSNCQDQVIIQR